MLAIDQAAVAATGDVLKVTAERANLRAGPSDKAQQRGQVQAGDDLIELQRQGEWVGVRVGRTGEEGWIYSKLVQLASASTLSREAAPSGFKNLSPGFDTLVRSTFARRQMKRRESPQAFACSRRSESACYIIPSLQITTE